MTASYDSSPLLLLASSSPYRRELLKRLRVPFNVVIPAIDEQPHPGEMPATTALRLAEQKARAVAATYPAALVIGADQVASYNGYFFGKPGSHENALAQLRTVQAQGRLVEFHSAVCLYDGARDNAQTADVVTQVRFRHLEEAELAAYLHAEKPYDVAGSAKAEGLGISLFETIKSDDPTALIGLPLIALTSMLRRAGYPLLEVISSISERLEGTGGQRAKTGAQINIRAF